MATTDVLAPFGKFLIKRPGNRSAFFVSISMRDAGRGRIACRLPPVAPNPRMSDRSAPLHYGVQHNAYR